MKKSRYSEEQIATALRQVEAGAPIPEVTRSLGVSEATYYPAPAATRGGKPEAQAARRRSDLG